MLRINRETLSLPSLHSKFKIMCIYYVYAHYITIRYVRNYQWQKYNKNVWLNKNNQISITGSY
jgi:hypothetical protein